MRRRLPRIALNLFLVGHLSALVLNNLPWSPFIQALFGAYNWYVSVTGQVQDWGMYSRLDRNVSHFRLALTYPDGTEILPWGEQYRMGPRRLYLLEGLFTRSGGDRIAQRFFDYLRLNAPFSTGPVRAYAVMEQDPIGGRGLASSGSRDSRILEKRW